MIKQWRPKRYDAGRGSNMIPSTSGYFVRYRDAHKGVAVRDERIEELESMEEYLREHDVWGDFKEWGSR